MRAFGYCLLAGLLLCLPAADAGVWEDRFDTFEPENWTAQTGGLRLWQEPPPAGAVVRDGVLLLKEPLSGVRLTSRQRFLYGTLEARVRIRPTGSQYFGFMSRTLGQQQLEPDERTGRLADDARPGQQERIRRHRVPGPAGRVVHRQDRVAAERVTVYLDDRLQGELTDAARIPQAPMPIILDVGQPNVAMEFDWIRVTGSTFGGERAIPPPRAAKLNGKTLSLTSADCA